MSHIPVIVTALQILNSGEPRFETSLPHLTLCARATFRQEREFTQLVRRAIVQIGGMLQKQI